MTNRICAYWVVLDRDVREDDAEPVLNAIRMVKGVAEITPVVSGVDIHVARERELARWRGRLLDLIEEMKGI